MIKLNRDGWAHRLYKFTYDRWASENFCVFFWLMAVALLVFPFTFISIPHVKWGPYRQQPDGFLGRVFVSAICWFFLALITGYFVLGYHFPSAVAWTTLKAVGGIIVFFVGAGIFCLVAEHYDRRQWARSYSAVKEESELRKILRAKKESFFGKYCPKIDWES